MKLLLPSALALFGLQLTTSDAPGDQLVGAVLLSTGLSRLLNNFP